MSAGVRQIDIARACGLSRTAVAYALNPRFQWKVSQENRQRILQTARRLGYRPNKPAQLMRGVRSGVIGMIQCAAVGQLATQRTYHVAHAVKAAGYELLANDTVCFRGGVKAACAAMLDAHVEGVILVSPAEWLPREVLDHFRNADIPVVALSGVRLPDVPQVASNHRQGMIDLVRHLLRIGHRRLALLTAFSTTRQDDVHCWPILNRIDGFREAVLDAGGSLLPGGAAGFDAPDGRPQGWVMLHEPPTDWGDPYQVGYEAGRHFLRQGHRPDVLVAGNDDWAMGLLRACAECGLAIPADIAVTGFDGAVFSAYGPVPLTTVAQPLHLMARRSVDWLIRLIRGQEFSLQEQRQLLPCELIVRQSCGAAMHHCQTL